MKQQTENQTDDRQPEKLMISGLIYLPEAVSNPVTITRGMIVVSRDGQEVGQVAALIVDDEGQPVSHLLLTQLHLVPEYRLVPLRLITQVNEGIVSLNIACQAIAGLPRH